jgi:broad specificity phosphatase PhoE
MSNSRTGNKTALVMVGLPARGKSYIARRLDRYLGWLGHKTRVFNVGNYRRRYLGAHKTHEFFDPSNAEAVAARRDMASRALEDMLRWLGEEDGEVAIYDATNTTRTRRQMVREGCEYAGVKVIFVETMCDDPAIIEANIRATKLHSPDYEGRDPDEVVRDFRQRIEHYREAYEPLEQQQLRYVKLIDAGRQVVVNRIDGHLGARVVSCLMNVRLSSHRVVLSRHGQSMFNVEGRIGGDADLSERGRQYADRLANYVWERPELRSNLTVWTSTLQRARQTAAPLGVESKAWRALDEIGSGVCDGMTYEEIRERMPHEWAARQADKLRYRYPRGESYEDVIQRLDPLIAALERVDSPALVIAHQAVLRALYSYIVGRPAAECPHLPIPLHTVIELTPTAYGCDEQRIPLGELPDSPSS